VGGVAVTAVGDDVVPGDGDGATVGDMHATSKTPTKTRPRTAIV